MGDWCAEGRVLCDSTTWEDVDVNDGEGVRVYVDDDIYSKKRHAELRAELSDQRGHGLRAGRRKVGHLLIQLGGRDQETVSSEAFSSRAPSSFSAGPQTRNYRCEIRAGLWLGHLVAVEEYRLSVCTQSAFD